MVMSNPFLKLHRKQRERRSGSHRLQQGRRTVQKITYVLALLTALLFGAFGEAVAQSAPSPYLTGDRYQAGGVLPGTISPAPSGTSNFPATRNTYDSNGRLAMVETGVLAS
jgi:hypothetical protein